MFNRIPQILKSFSRYERYIFLASFLVFIISSIFLLIKFINQNTFLVSVSGGEYREGIIGQPTFINPVLVGNNDSDRDLTELIFSDLLDLAESYKMNSKGAVWNVRLKENVFWHDGKTITSDDVIFTVRTIQDFDTRSPFFSNWQGVVAERISEREVKFILSAPYAFFEGTLKELKPIPKHLFSDIPAANLKLSNYNLEPIGSGSFKFDSLQKRRDGFITDYKLIRNENYFGQKPYLDQIIFKFFLNNNELIEAFNSGVIDGFGGVNPKSLTGIKLDYQVFKLIMPRYYAVFFNGNSQPLLSERNIRLALDLATDRQTIIEEVFLNHAIAAFGPLIPSMEGYSPDIFQENSLGFEFEEANQLLDNDGWQVNDEGIREKDFTNGKKEEILKLEFKLVVPEIPFLTETANIIQEDWGKIGVKLDLIILQPSDINNEIIKTRDYEMILFGNIFGRNPDLFSFWHSSERFYPGLNLSLYDNEEADALIESIRESLKEESRQRNLNKLQLLIIGDQPAIFLYSPFYFYISKNQLGGFEEKFIPLPSERFENIERWYLKTERRFR
ncbi:MAG: peptide ABC transporter substrate-binding protein [Candidatus Paceibacterota bacterium]